MSATTVQARLFPQALPALRTLDYAGVCIQARQVGGDYYDFLNLGQDRLGLVLGDISGKGIAGALLMANLQANLRSQCAFAVDDLPRLLRGVNALFYDNTADSAYASLFFAEYADQAERLRYVSCGHLPALLLRGDDVLRLDSTCTVLGLFGLYVAQVTGSFVVAGAHLIAPEEGVLIKVIGIPVFFSAAVGTTFVHSASRAASVPEATWVRFVEDTSIRYRSRGCPRLGSDRVFLRESPHAGTFECQPVTPCARGRRSAQLLSR